MSRAIFIQDYGNKNKANSYYQFIVSFLTYTIFCLRHFYHYEQQLIYAYTNFKKHGSINTEIT